MEIYSQSPIEDSIVHLHFILGISKLNSRCVFFLHKFNFNKPIERLADIKAFWYKVDLKCVKS